MEHEPKTDTSEHDDERATQPPADDPHASQGSQGNPEVDEEALANRQQEAEREE